ncbi:MAG: 4-hydroxy-tetrahydrodipicolinate synthase [Solirubrobacteraceae bacterium]|nr:4-hydroxy-tetrahydrodipicolinate synthase [Solirubrobacteraceae bacterium]
MSDLGALLTAIVTPFADPSSGSRKLKPAVDEEAFTRLHHHVIEQGSDGIVACGTTGEASTLDDDEHLRVIELAVQNKPAGTTVIAGAGSNDTAHAVYLTERATELGADAILSVTPYYNRPNRQGLVRHYEEIARATDKPIVLYNIPHRAGLDLSNEFLAELAQIDGISAVKQANPANLALIDGLELYAGDDDVLGKVMDLGGAGGICTASHLVGAKFRQIIDDPSSRASVTAELAPLFAGLSAGPLAVSVKAALVMQGILERATVRLPYAELTDGELAQVREGLAAVGALSTEARA